MTNVPQAEAAPPRDPVRVELVIHDAPARGRLTTLRAALGWGLVGAGLAGAAGSFAARSLVIFTESPNALQQCQSPVEAAVHSALGNFMLAQGIALGCGFAVFFVIGFVRQRRA